MNKEQYPEVDTLMVNALLNIREEEQVRWSEKDLSPVWKLLMQAPLKQELEDSLPGARRVLDQFAGEIPSSFGELLFQPKPSCELLRLVKDFAKKQGNSLNRLLPKEICSALYYICIYLALKAGDSAITGLGAPDTRKGVEWVRGQAWLDEHTKSILAPVSLI